MTSPRVFAVSNPVVLTRRGYAPKYDLEPAKKFGELYLMFKESAVNPFANPALTYTKMHQCLFGNSFCEQDYLLLVGNPTLTGWASIAAMQQVKALTTLQWVRSREQYVPVTLQLK